MSNLRSTSRKPAKRNISSEQKLFFLVLLSAVPVLALLAYIFADEDISLQMKLGVSGVCLIWLLSVAATVREKFVYHLRTLSNLIEAIRTEDYSMRSSRVRDAGELAELYQQINSLTNQLKGVRQDEFELSSLLERIVNQINVAIIANNNEGKIRLVNRLACKLFDTQAEQLIDQSLQQTPLANFPIEQGSRLIDYDFPGANGRWQINVQPYRHQGKPGQIIFITDLKQVLSEEEINAWQRLIRVIAHEVNNSLTPISSICQTLDSHLSKMPEQENYDDLKQGLSVIEERAKGLRDFISVYARIAKLPDPQKINFSVNELLKKLKRFFADRPIEINQNDTEITLFGDPVLIEQALINLIKNGMEASAGSELPVEISCQKLSGHIEFLIVDSGTGISNPANLFVPFYTTKAKGAGIGLTLCRQIAAKHSGQVVLENRTDAKGALARLQIPYLAK